jgi:hypothetical protein
MIKNNLCILVILLLNSCASNLEEEKNRLLQKNEHKDLVTSFEIPKEDANNYKENSVESKTTNPITVEKKVSKKTKKELKKKKVSTVAEAILPASTAAFVYPADFPEDFKAMDLKSQSIWEKFKPLFYQGEQSILAISYLGVTAGYITVSSQNIVNIGGRNAFHYTARFKSREAYRYFYWLDDSLETYIEKSTYLPIKYSLIQREKKQNVDDLQLFDFKKLKTSNWYKREKEGVKTDDKNENYIPRFVQDSFSALQFTRGLPLKKGDTYDFPVVTRGKAWLLKLEVLGEETTTVNDHDIKAIKIKAETHFPGVLQKSGDIIFWYAADDMRRLLKFQAKVKLGSIFGELVDFKAGTLVK